MYTADVALNRALGLYSPTRWSRLDWAIDLTDKLVRAAATGAVMHHLSR